MKTIDFLEHYGTKGMKWGVRKKPGSGVRKTSAKAKPTSKKVKGAGKPPKPTKTKTGRGAKTKGLSDNELKARVNRLNMEKQYKTMKRENANSISRGFRLTTSILGKTAKTATSNYLANVIFKNLIEYAGDAAGRRSSRAAVLTRR